MPTPPVDVNPKKEIGFVWFGVGSTFFQDDDHVCIFCCD